MKKQTYLIMLALVAFFAAFAFSSCNTTNPAEQPNDNNGQDSTIVQNPNNNDNLNIPEITPLDKSSGCLNGAFAIGENKYVHFSRGNLQYTQSTDTWSFAEQQYEILGEKNLKNAELTYDGKKGQSYEGTDLDDKIDLFGWSGSTGAAKWGISTSEDWSDYSGDFVDWGMNPISNGGNKSNQWRTLTYDEWYYLRRERTNYDKLIGIAQVAGVNGLILLPDNWTLPAGLSFKSGFFDERNAYAYAPYQSYTSTEWSRMESAGAVFLPASGYRDGADIDDLGYYGRYWSATPDGEYGAGYLYFYSSEADLNWDTRNYGSSVRLVQDVQ